MKNNARTQSRKAVCRRSDSVRVGMYAGGGTNPARLTRCLRGFGFAVRALSTEVIAALTCGDCDVLYLPGGWYFFPDSAKAAIISFVRRGGGCVGTCAGAYNVAGFIPVIPGRVLRGNFRGRLYLEPQRGEHPILRGVVQPCTRHKQRQWEPIAVTHIGGPFMLPEDRRAIVASFDIEGELGALLAASVGKGRAVALASHPEMPLAQVPARDPVRQSRAPLPQGDVTLLIRNAVLWAARRPVPC